MKNEPIILYRPDSDLIDFDKELEAMRCYFECTDSRNDPCLKNRTVIGRYSVLPYYKELEHDLSWTDAKLLNSYKQHRFIADMSNWVDLLQGMTPPTWFTLFDTPKDAGPFVLKGETNSRKQKWGTHMYAETWEDAQRVLFRLEDDLFFADQQIYIRKFIPLKQFFTAINGLPITEEYRFFVANGTILSGGYYWSNFVDEFKDGPPSVENVPGEFLQEAIDRVESAQNSPNFYVIDVARVDQERSDWPSEWIVIELNDGQQSGISENDPYELYLNLRESL